MVHGGEAVAAGGTGGAGSGRYELDGDDRARCYRASLFGSVFLQVFSDNDCRKYLSMVMIIYGEK
jgi:hypothetical protein